MVADVPRQVSLRRFPDQDLMCYHITLLSYLYIILHNYNRVTFICIDLSKIKLFVFVFTGAIKLKIIYVLNNIM